MKPRIKELEVDTIGEPNRPLTKEEELQISAFIKKRKEQGQVNKTKEH
ncbi:hypothetical protein [Parabacteroides sp. PF5-9]|nr:hypothetical protein [Parabacteroides sp. PF5-9]MDH6358905.1 hypothetical protein [Parabacteroides sp. PF5-9]